jgi:two-component system, cell cycle sensor histidine kinase and response regulator CckA
MKRVGDPASYPAARLLDAFAKVPAYVAVLSGPEHRYVFVNEAYAAVVDVDDPIGKPFGSSNHDESARLRTVLNRVYETGVPYSAPEVPLDGLPGADGTRCFNVNFLPLRGQDGRVDGVLVHSFDVTDLVTARRLESERRALEAQLLHVQKLESLGLLAGGIAHDFNNMLTAVSGSIAAAVDVLSAEGAAVALLRDATEGVRRAVDLTRQLLAYSGKGQFHVQNSDVSREVEGLAPLLQASIPKKVTLRTNLGKGLPPIAADVAQLQQVVMNLVINGGEAIGDAIGTVSVKTSLAVTDEGEVVRIEVSDTGPGMTPDVARKIFDPFFSTKFTGRGLGLAAVDGIVRAHKGHIDVTTMPGAGAKLTVSFPAASGPVPVRPSPETEPVRGTGLVLIVDDDAAVRKVLQRVLEGRGFEVAIAVDGEDALAVFRSRQREIRFVIVDMTMPKLNGEETFRELRRMSPDVRVVIASGYDVADSARTFEGPRPVAFLPKPFSGADLSRCIRAALGEG